jgi:hypothetical protein
MPGGRFSFGGQVMYTAIAAPVRVAQDAYQKAFVARLPRIEARARAAFRYLRCPHDRDDAVAEVVASAWERFRLVAHPDAVAAGRLGADAVAYVRTLLASPRSVLGRI